MTIADAAHDALPLLIRSRLLDAVRMAQAAERGPVTAAEVLARLDPPLARSPRALTALMHRVAATGPDERGRQLAGEVDRLSVWRWVVEGGDPREAAIATRAGELAHPGEDLLDVLTRALAALAAQAELDPPAVAPIQANSSPMPDPIPNEPAPRLEPPQETPSPTTAPEDHESVAQLEPQPDPQLDPLSALFGLTSEPSPMAAALARLRSMKEPSE